MTLNFLTSHSARFKEILDNVLDEPTDTGHVSKMCLTTPVPGDTFRSQMQVDSRLNGSLLNIVLRDDGAEQDEVADEIIFVVRGYVVNKNLPPLGAELKRAPISASQSIEITGLGSEKFQESLRNIVLLHGLLHDNVPSGELLKLNPRQNNNSHLCLLFKTRYLTPHAELDADAPQVPSQYLSEIDPYGVLDKFKEIGKHVIDNQVLYWERVPKLHGTGWNYRKTKPSAIRVGHLVECQVSFSAVRLGGTYRKERCNYLMLQKLRSVCVLDRTVEEDEATFSALPKQVEPKSTPRKLRRRIGYGENDSDYDEGNTERLKRLRLDDILDGNVV